MSVVNTSGERRKMPLVIAFLSLNGYTVQASRTPDDVVADTLDAYYELVETCVLAAGGSVVKFIGDGALVVFPIEQADAGIGALLDLKAKVDRWFGERDWSCYLVARIHAGPAIAGLFGKGSSARFDVIGNAVNIAATIRTSGVALTAEAFRKLSPATRKRFKKHTPPITYIPREDRHPHRSGRGRASSR